MNDQLIGKRVDETADGNEISAPDNRVGDAATGNIADFDRAGNQGGDVGRRGRDEDQIYVQAIFLVDPFVLGDIPISVRSIHRAVGNLEFFLRVSLATNKQECRYDKSHSPMWRYSHAHRILLLPCIVVKLQSQGQGVQSQRLIALNSRLTELTKRLLDRESIWSREHGTEGFEHGGIARVFNRDADVAMRDKAPRDSLC